MMLVLGLQNCDQSHGVWASCSAVMRVGLICHMTLVLIFLLGREEFAA